ncbi:YesL family protein [Fredinandcohnia sp. 179-A 10B2 NHS]|uniref:YesL family protein n=1 Tax=Fredinandcohnia sp. 179-A 10B2 NHS TaxID=3235176 RepID=UPI00399F0D6D
MRFLNSKFYSIAETLTNFFFLNIIWLVMCLPIFTIFPATAAMFGVIRQWIINKDTSVFRTFFKMFKENFKHSFIIGTTWMIYLGVATIDYLVINQWDSYVKTIIVAVLLAIGLLLSLVSIRVFPMMVHFNLPLSGLIKNSFSFSLLYLPTTLLMIIILAVMMASLYFAPITFLFIFSLTAYIIYYLCHKEFTRLEQLPNSNKTL